MNVKRENFNEVLQKLSVEPILSYDTETTCLHWWDSPFWAKAGIVPRVFAIQIATPKEEFYFDFLEEFSQVSYQYFNKLTHDPAKLWFIANAKFDMHHSRNHGIEFAGTIHCTKAIARVCNNVEPSLKLDDLGAKYLGVGKIDVISEMKEHGFVSKVKRFGHNDKFEDQLHFDQYARAFPEKFIDYGCCDVRLCFDLGMKQRECIADMDTEIFKGNGKALAVMHNEYALTKILFEMEHTGIQIDIDYTKEAYEHEVQEYRKIEKELNELAGQKVDWNSAKQLKPIFEAQGEPYSYTEKGNASFDREALDKSSSKLAKKIIAYRYHYKRAHTYFENFIWLADTRGVLHADSQQAGTETGRMSYWTPNLQNVPKRGDKDEAHYKVRRCFIPRPGYVFADFDYSGAEYRLALDYAKELPVIEMLQKGLDPHEKLRIDMSLKDRDAAKTMQFRILYGAGFEAVGRSLGYDGVQAKTIGKEKKLEYFRRLPRVAELLSNISSLASQKGYVFNWLGRVLYYDRNTSYKSPNGVIQSGVGDMTKKAMVLMSPALASEVKSRMLLQVHDAILFEIHKSELTIIGPITESMRQAYPHKLLPMEVAAGFSDRSWAELQDEIPA